MFVLSRSGSISALVAGSIALIFLGVSLILPHDLLICDKDTDMISGFVASRGFLADSFSHGHLPLWNPYNYAGQPFLAGFESAVLYPPNLMFLVLPLACALNFSILLHLVILGWGMERWACNRGFHPGASALAGFMMPLTGAVFPHIYAGHLSNLSSMAWAPWIFLGLEKWVRGSDRQGLFLCSAAIGLQILAGHIQYFFYTAVAAGVQALALSFADPATRRRALPTVVGCYLAGLALAAAQFLPGLDASTEGVRSHKLDYGFAAEFGFPPENFLTLIAPGFFGNLGSPAYWGRCYLWEMSLFIGAAAPLLIAIALADKVAAARRSAVLDLGIAAVLLVPALGIHTPLFNLLYYFVPGFGDFRSWSKFIFPATLFLALVVAAGADVLLRGGKFSRGIPKAGLVAGVLIAGAGLVLMADPQALHGLFAFVGQSGESCLPAGNYANPEFFKSAALHAGLSLGLAGTILVVAAAILLGLPRRPALRWALPAIIAVEMVGFAAGQISVAHVYDGAPASFRHFLADQPGDYRIINLATVNNGFPLGVSDLGGNNPSVLRRYAEFVAFTQGQNPDSVTQYLTFDQFSHLFALVRAHFAFVRSPQGTSAIESPVPPLPHLLLVSAARVLPGRDAIFSAMSDPEFDPAKTVLLEKTPPISPQAGAQGSVQLLSASADKLVIEADAPTPTILLITDLYDHNWRATSLPGSVQQDYQLMPADYILRAVPLAAGHHRLQVVYQPASFTLGVIVSLVSLGVWLYLLWAGGQANSYPAFISKLLSGKGLKVTQS
jgi:hypothetical protein